MVQVSTASGGQQGGSSGPLHATHSSHLAAHRGSVGPRRVKLPTPPFLRWLFQGTQLPLLIEPNRDPPDEELQRTWAGRSWEGPTLPDAHLQLPCGVSVLVGHRSHAVKRRASFLAHFLDENPLQQPAAELQLPPNTNVKASSKPPVTAAFLLFPSHPSHGQHQRVPNSRIPRCPIPEPNDPSLSPRHNARP